MLAAALAVPIPVTIPSTPCRSSKGHDSRAEEGLLVYSSYLLSPISDPTSMNVSKKFKRN